MTSVAELNRQLHGQLEALQALHEVLTGEADALRSAEPQALADFARAKTECLQRVQDQQRALVDRLQQLGCDVYQQDLAEWLREREASRGELTDLLTQVRGIARECGELNQRNGAVIEGTRWYVADALDAITGVGGGGANTYDAQGSQGAEKRHHIGTA